MADQRTREQLEEQLAQSLYSILANYQREGSGPGSRFEGQTVEAAQAKFAARTVLNWQCEQVATPDPSADYRERLAEEMQRLSLVVAAGVGAHALLADAQAAVSRVRAKHSESPYRPGWCCCANPVPCPTITALDGTDQPGQEDQKLNDEEAP